MIFQEMESLDTVEAVMAFEKVFGAELPDDDCGKMDSPREVVDWLERHLTKQRPNKQAAAWLRRLRRSLTSWLMANGENPQIVRAMLRWTNLNMPAHYTHGFKADKLEA